MSHELSRISLVAALLASTAMFATAINASESKAVDNSKVQEAVQEAVQESKESVKSSEKVVESGDKGTEVGEASYNVESCEALIEEAENGESAKAGTEKLDLDKCKQLIK